MKLYVQKDITYQLQNKNWNLVRINKGECTPFLDIKQRFISFENDINKIVELLVKK